MTFPILLIDYFIFFNCLKKYRNNKKAAFLRSCFIVNIRVQYFNTARGSAHS